MLQQLGGEKTTKRLMTNLMGGQKVCLSIHTTIQVCLSLHTVIQVKGESIISKCPRKKP